MIRCPFCQFENEDGALFCEQCKSDLAGAIPVAQAEAAPEQHPHVPAATPVFAETVPEPVPAAQTVPYEPIPVAGLEPEEVIPLAAEPVEALPVNLAEAKPVAPAPPATPAPSTLPPTPPDAAPPAAATPTPPAPAQPAPSAPPAAAPAGALPPGAQPRLLVLRGQKRNVEYPIYDGLNFIGRADEKPVDIDLEDQEPPDRIWCSRQHACISFENDQLAIEDLNSSNGTYVNRTRVYPGQKRPLNPNDIIQIGNVQMKVIV
jgi:pSer/pThr/pTyr-binding forkhead associated (FHA) protein